MSLYCRERAIEERFQREEDERQRNAAQRHAELEAKQVGGSPSLLT